MNLKVHIFQKNVKVGDLKNNFIYFKKAYLKSVKDNVDLFLTPELYLSGYPPKDLLLRTDFLKKNLFFVNKIKSLSKNKKTTIVLGAPRKEKDKLFNSVLIISNGKIIFKIDKSILPNFGVFDEKRYFSPGLLNKNCFKYKNQKIQFLICEDFWNDELVNHLKNSSLDLIIVTNASPYEKEKYPSRIKLAKKRVKELKAPLIYVNLVGAQDDLVFDGGSFCLNKNKNLIFHAPFFKDFDNNFSLNLLSKQVQIKRPYYDKSRNM